MKLHDLWRATKLSLLKNQFLQFAIKIDKHCYVLMILPYTRCTELRVSCNTAG